MRAEPAVKLPRSRHSQASPQTDRPGGNLISPQHTLCCLCLCDARAIGCDSRRRRHFNSTSPSGERSMVTLRSETSPRPDDDTPWETSRRRRRQRPGPSRSAVHGLRTREDRWTTSVEEPGTVPHTGGSRPRRRRGAGPAPPPASRKTRANRHVICEHPARCGAPGTPGANPGAARHGGR